MVKLYQSKAWLYQRYVLDKKTIVEMAAEAKCSNQSIQSNLEKHGLIRNGRKWAK